MATDAGTGDSGVVVKAGPNGCRISIPRVAGAAYAVICGFQATRASMDARYPD